MFPPSGTPADHCVHRQTAAAKPKPKMLTLCDLPVELLTEIVSQVAAEDISTLCLVDRYLFIIASPYRWRMVESSERILRYFIFHPAHRRYVKRIVCHQAAEAYDYSDEQKILLRAAAEATSLPLESFGCEEDIVPIEDYVIMYLLHLLPRAQKIDFIWNHARHSDTNDFLGQMLSSAMSREIPEAFKAVREVEYAFVERDEDEEYKSRFSNHLLPTFALPRVRKVSLQNIFYDGGNIAILPAGLAYHKSSVEHISIRNCEIFADRDTFWPQILNLPKRLVKFEYKHGSFGYGGIYDHMDTVAGVLRKSYKETLEFLSVKGEVGEDPVEVIGSLRRFNSLKYIRIPFEIMVGFNAENTDVELCDLLPPSLETLSLTFEWYHDINRYFDALSGVIEAKQRHCYELQKLVVRGITDSKYYDAVYMLFELCDNADIELHCKGSR